jgi:hypothetical protein
MTAPACFVCREDITTGQRYREYATGGWVHDTCFLLNVGLMFMDIQRVVRTDYSDVEVMP